MKQNKKQVVIFAMSAVMLIALVGLAIYLKGIFDYKQAVKNITFQSIDVTKVVDGTYTGECDVNVIYAKVQVTVHSGKIINIAILEHKNDRGQAAEAVVSKIVDEQRIEVDAVSGATNSSLVLKKAVENAIAK